MRRWAAISDERAVSTVEFALIAPVLLLILVGILDLGRAVNAYVTVGNAAREGTHYLTTHPLAPESAVRTAVRDRVVPLDPATVGVEAFYYEGGAFQDWPTSAPTPNPSPSMTPVRVTVSYDWRAVTFIGQFFPSGSGAGFSVSSTVDMFR